MSKKIDFNFLHNFLQFIQAKNKWKISEILDNLDISFKELIYILDIVSQIYVDFDDVSKNAKALTPVPGGVGPMTIACLLKNTIECFKRSQK